MITRKQGIPGKAVPLNKLPKQQIPPLPRAVVDRFPELAGWERETQARLSLMQQRLWEQQLGESMEEQA